MKVNLHFENVCQTNDSVPNQADFQVWVNAALINEKRVNDKRNHVSVSVRVVDEEEISEMNSRYRSKPGPTNVLSFPFEDPPGVESAELGDVVICAPLVAREADEQKKSKTAHWAHLLVHGMLHLQGYNHKIDAEAKIMEDTETRILTGLGFPEPYI